MQSGYLLKQDYSSFSVVIESQKCKELQWQ